MKKVIACLLTVILLLQPAYAAATGLGTEPEASVPEQTEQQTDTDTGSEEAGGSTESTAGTEEGTGDSTESTTGTEPSGEDNVQEAAPFSCYTFDGQGRQLNGYWSEEEAAWYLFVPSTLTVEDLVIHYTGDITGATAGQVDAENAVVTGAFSANGGQVSLTMADETVHNVVVMQSRLPSVHITLNGVTLDEVHKDKNIKYKKNTVSIMDPGGEYDLLVEDSVEFKGRGNSTWQFYEKKGYQIKFDEKTSVLGMGKAKKWVLLANASDDSLMRTQLVYRMAEELGMAFVPSFEYVDLWIDGDYRGTYIIGEKIEPGSSRLDLSDDAGAIFELDEAFYSDEDYWFYSKYLRQHFVMKEIVAEEDEIISSAMADFESSVDELAAYLYSTPSDEVTVEELSAMIDVDSFAKYFLVNEYAMNKESFVTSFYWYKDGPEDVIHLGPIWDFDTCMGNDGTSNTESYGQNYFLFNYLLAAPVFYDRVLELADTYKPNFASMTADVDAIKDQIAISAEMNYLRWDVLGKPNPKGGSDFCATFDEAVSTVQSWLQGRENAFKVVQSKAVTSVVSDDCYEMDIYLQDDENYSQVKFAVWSVVDGQDDLAWYHAYQTEDGTWRCTVDLTKHHSVGLYRIDAYANNEKPWVATGCNYVAEVRESPYKLNADVSEDCKNLTIMLEDSGRCSNITFAVWSEKDSQDDLKWYPAEKNSEGIWSCSVDLGEHQSAGEYTIHAYTGNGNARRLVDEHSVAVAFAVYNPTAVTEIAEDYSSMSLELKHAHEYENVWVEVWNTKDAQSDVEKYTLVKQSDGCWTGTVELADYNGLRAYRVAFYGIKDAAEALIISSEIVVEKDAYSVYRLYNLFTGEHLLTSSDEEMEQLIEAGWSLDGIAWNAPASGDPVYRLYNPYDDWHTYSMSEDEISKMTALGWTVDGIVFSSAEAVNCIPVYRLFNPYEQKNYHLLTASVEEREMLLNLGWTLDGIALNAVFE